MSKDVVREEKLITSTSCRQEEEITMDSSLFCWFFFLLEHSKLFFILAVRHTGNAAQVHYSLELQMTKKSKPILSTLITYFYFI